MEKGHCIICHRDGVELSDEHVIPDAIGGYYHIYSVCKECNSKLGNQVDSYLLKHWFIVGARHNNRLAGKTKKIPNPLIGDGEMEDGTKVRLEEDKSGKLVTHILPTAPKISSDGKNVTITLDEKDEKLADNIKKKAFKKMKLTSGAYRFDTSKTVHQIMNPWVRMQVEIDLKNYKIGILKIAYEFAVDKIPIYYMDPMARLYSEILHDAAIDRLDEVNFEGDGLVHADKMLLEDFIDYSNVNRHILVLTNINGKLYCMVKLFQNVMCQMIRMSDKEYGATNGFILALNDFSKHECHFYTEHELIRKCVKNEYVGVHFSTEVEKIIKAEMDSSLTIQQVGFACNMNNENIFYDNNGDAICTQNHLIVALERKGDVEKHVDGNKITSKYPIPKGLSLMLMPSKRLVAPECLVYVNEFEKL